jgi:hypothetical protein
MKAEFYLRNSKYERYSNIRDKSDSHISIITNDRDFALFT